MDDTLTLEAPAILDDTVEAGEAIEIADGGLEELLVEEISIDGMCGVY